MARHRSRIADRRAPAVARATPSSNRAVAPKRFGLARVISKLGYCSRSQAEAMIAAGRVQVDGIVRRDAEFPVDAATARIAVDGANIATARRIYLMLNKPRGLLTTTKDEQGRDTVYTLLRDAGLPWLAPVGRLDKASEGLLLFSNDSAWAAAVLEPETHIDKTYHVQIDRLLDAADLAQLVAGVEDGTDKLAAKAVKLLRQGEKNCWLEVVLDEGKNRQIRRLLAALDISVLRLLRVSIGALQLGELAKGQWRYLSEDEVRNLAAPTCD